MSGTIRIGLSTSVVQGGRSGVATYIFGILRGLRRIGAPVEVSVIGLENDRGLFEPWLDRCKWVPVPERFRPAVKNVAWHQFALPGLARREGFDLIHIPSYRRIVARLPCPQLVTIHDCAAFAVAGKYDLARMIYGRVVVKWLARNATRVTTVSRATAADVMKYFGLPEKRIDVIWNGIDHERFKPTERGAADGYLKAHFQRGNPYFIYLARLEHPGKNHVRLIEAFEMWAERNPELKHELWLGGADWHGAEVIHARAASSPLSGRIRLLGFVRLEDLPLLYAGAEAMIYPSLFEGFGLPPIEAMACGTPVISSGCGSLEEVTGTACLRIDPLKVETMAEALARVSLEPTMRADLIRRGLEHAAQFSWDRAAEKLMKSYWAALGKGDSIEAS